MPRSFEADYPTITRWVKEFGRIEIGSDDFTDSFVRAIDAGGMPWEGKSRYDTLDDALLDMEKGIKAFLKDQGLDAKSSSGLPRSRNAATKPRKSAGEAAKNRHRPDESPIAKKVKKLGEIAEALHQGENFSVTRLTIIKSLCEDPQAAGAFAVFLARKIQRKMRQDEGQKRYRQLVNRTVKELATYLDKPTKDRKERLTTLLHEMQAEQNEYKRISWGMVRIVRSMDLLVVEKALRSVLRSHEAPFWLYQAARDYAERYSPRYGTGLIPSSAEVVQEIAEFWRKYFGIKR
jgi:hypothetical protein